MLRSILCLLVALGAVMNVCGQIVVPVGDSLAVIPAHPTTSDRITLDLIIRNWDCCTQYTFDSTVSPLSPGDTEILLSCQSSTPQVCPLIACISTQKVLAYKCAPLPSGSYAVYESKQVACVTQICPELSGPIMAPVKIGEFTVVSSTGVQRQLAAAGSGIRNTLPRSEEIFNARGERLNGTLSSRRLVDGLCFIKSSSGTTMMQTDMAR